jgi:pentapeptide MXKDX repeat protein
VVRARERALGLLLWLPALGAACAVDRDLSPQSFPCDRGGPCDAAVDLRDAVIGGEDASVILPDAGADQDAAASMDAADDATVSADAAATDATSIDAQTVDAAHMDAGAADAQIMDAARMDAARMDAAGSDAQIADVMHVDAAGRDALVAPDAVAPDAVAPDAVAPDAVAPDAVAPDAVAPDAVAPDAVAPDALAPDAVAPDAMAPDAMAPDAGCADASIFRGGLCLPPPVAYWPLDEGGTSTVANDISGNAMNGSLTGPAWVTGKVGPYALSFDGVDDFVLIGNSTELNFDVGSFTIALYVYVPQSVGAYDMPWFKGGASISTIGYDMELGTGNWTVNLNDGTMGYQAVFGVETLNTWVRLVAVVDRSANVLRAYMNGVLADSISIAGCGSLSGNASPMIGSDSTSAGTGDPFNGIIDDVIIFDSALTDAEVAALN